MLVTDLAGQQHKINLQRYLKKNEQASLLHIKCREILQTLYPTCKILEEVSIKIKPRKTLYLDFFIPLHKLTVEVQGEQHYARSSMFHKNRFAFARQLINDNQKREWCEINNIKLVELSYDKQEYWKDMLSGRQITKT